MTAQLAPDFSHDLRDAQISAGPFPDVAPPALLRVVGDEDLADGRGSERLATVHRLMVDVLGAEPAVVADARRAAAPVRLLLADPEVHPEVHPVARPVVTPTARPSTGRTPTPAIYRRRRLAVAVVLGLLVSALSLLGGELIGRVTGTAGSSVVEASAEPVAYVVQPGDTLWSIAATINPEGRDVRRTVDHLVAANGGAALEPGQLVLLPAD